MSRTHALLAATAALEKHAEHVVVLDLRALSSVADFFVIATAESRRQLEAITDHIEQTLAPRGGKIWHVEGSLSGSEASASMSREPQWVLLDCGDVIIHLFDPQSRAFYRLEELWADAPRLPVPAAQPS